MSERIGNYSIVSGEAFSVHGAIVELCQEVKLVMAHGWQPFGAAVYVGHVYTSSSSEKRHVFCQTLVKPQVGE